MTIQSDCHPRQFLAMVWCFAPLWVLPFKADHLSFWIRKNSDVQSCVKEYWLGSLLFGF